MSKPLPCEITPVGPELEVHEVSPAPAEIELDQNTVERVDDIWAREVQSRGEQLFNGSMLCFAGRDGDTLLGRFVEYKHYLAQKREPTLRDKLNITPLAVSGLICFDDLVVFGRRSSDVTAYPGFYELMPSGGLTEECRTGSTRLDYRGQILRELEDEVGLPQEVVRSIEPFALVFDPADNVYDVCMEITLDTARETLERSCGHTGEYRQKVLVASSELPSFLLRHAGSTVPTSLAILEARFGVRQATPVAPRSK